MSQISSYVEILDIQQAQSIENCNSHHMSLDYFCNTCKLSICSDCAIFGKDHKGHEFKGIDDVYRKHVEIIKDESNLLRRNLRDLALTLREVDSNLETILTNKEQRSVEILLYFEEINNKLENDYKNNLKVLNENRICLFNEILYLKKMKKEINKKIKNSSKSKLILKSNRIINLISEINSKPLFVQNIQSADKDFFNEAIPEFEFGIFEINNYTTIRNKCEITYSEILCVDGIC